MSKEVAENPSLKAYKDQIRRELQLMRNHIQDSIYYRLGVQSNWTTPGNVYMADGPK